MKKLNFVLLIVCLLSAYIVTAQSEARLMRFPAIHGNQIVFSYSGDLYTVSKNGGISRKLTNHIGYEMFARFSPDGKNIAFTAEYDGNREVYVMPSEGGVPKRLTYTATLSRDDISDRMGPNNIVMTWKDNENIVFRSRRKSFNPFMGHLYSVSINGGLPQQLPLPCGGFCSYSPDKNKLAYNKIFREFRTWKYYQGGMADDVWIYNFESKNLANITNNSFQDIIPMWYKDKIYYLSDRDRIMNMFVYDTSTKNTKKVTNFETYDIKFPSIGDKEIVFENGGYIYTLDLETEKLSKVNIQIKDDFIYSRDEIIDASKFIQGYNLSPDAKRIVYVARGDIFTVPAEKGIVRNLTKSSGTHDRNATWSPDGKYIAYVSDATGETEIYVIKQDGKSKPIQLTKDADTYKYRIIWSPDSKKILFADKKLRLQYVDVKTNAITLVEKAEAWEFNSYCWSPDSKWIAYARPRIRAFSRIFLYNIESENKYPVTDDWYNSGNPVFSDNGKYLFFTSSRDFHPIYSQTEWNHAYRDLNRLYFICLAKDTPSPFAPENSEVQINESSTGEGKSNTKSGKDDNAKKIVNTKIDIEEIQKRIIVLPGKGGNYYAINIVGDKVYFVRGGYKEKSKLTMYDLKKKKETELGKFSRYLISGDKKKMLIAKKKDYYVIDLPKAKISLKSDNKVDLSGLKVTVNKKEEWQQIFDEAWRQMRDFFYDPNMHGLDWEAINNKYKPLLEQLNHRDDLNYIIGEMIGELSVGHAYVSGGDKPKAEKVKMGLLGAELVKDTRGFYRIEKIFEGENWDEKLRSPLTDVGVNIKEGDYILAVNDMPCDKMNNIYSSLIGMADKQVELTINSKPDMNGSHKEIVIPVSDESRLYYFNWVRENIEKVNKATNGQVGYIHIPDMGVAGLVEFTKYFYPQLNKKALIIDDRGNGGGNVSPMIIERLRREFYSANVARNTAKSITPRQMHFGPKVCLINEYSASDGDLFPSQFKKYELGKLIGKRSWGGVVGIRGSLPFIDGATLRKPEFSRYDENGWMIEGYGVDPDIIVDNDPAKEYAGIDEQLNKAIEVILEELKTKAKDIPDIPPFPDKSK